MLESNKFTEEQIQFIKFAYVRDDFTIEEIAKSINVSKQSLMSKANNLNLKRPIKIIKDGFKLCNQCNTQHPATSEFFYKNKWKNDGFQSCCKVCELKKSKQKRIDKKNENRVVAGNQVVAGNRVVAGIVKKCKMCNEEKPLTEFYNSKNTKDGKNTYCKTCDNARRKKHRNTGGYELLKKYYE